MLSFQSSVVSLPTTLSSHRLRAFPSYDSLPQDLDPRLQSRARPKRVFPMEFDVVIDNPAPNQGPPRRLASPERSNLRHMNATRTNSAHPKGGALAPSDKDAEGSLSSVWDTYVEVATKADSSMLDGWNRSIDVLLTGLFSAVLTTFLIESYHQLIDNPTEETNVLLAELIGSLGNGTSSAPSVSTQRRNSNIATGGVNGLWFAALACSLSTALISMLAKQWLQHYQSHESGSSQQRARSRQVKYLQLQAWKVPAIINALPLLLHVALLLFFAGLILLLWVVDLGVALATSAICFLAYGFYLASIVLPFIYPGCPYYHPVSGYLRGLLLPTNYNLHASNPLSMASASRLYQNLVNSIRATNYREDEVDALALAWLLSCTNDAHVRNQVLRGIASLPFHFSALHILRESGAEMSALEAFEDCFQRDNTADREWHLVDPIGAEVFCRAWLILTWRLDLQWPLELLDPLWILQDSKSHPDAAAMATCAIAKSSLDSMPAQWEVISFLGQSVYAQTLVSSTTRLWLLETIIETLSRWEMPTVVVEQTAVKTLPVLLQLLHLYEDSPGNSRLRSAAALVLYIITVGPIGIDDLLTEERRCDEYCRLMVQSLSCVVEGPQRFGATEKHLDMISRMLTRFAPAMMDPVNRHQNALRFVTRSSVSKLFADGRISLGTVADAVLADALQLIYPPSQIHSSRHSVFVASLLENVELSTHPDVVSWSIRCLEVVLARPSPSLVDEFMEKDGVNFILRAARTGVYSSRLQIDSLRAVCTFVRSSTELHMKQNIPFDKHLTRIFESDFFDTLLSVLGSESRQQFAYRQPGAWWLSEAVRHWIPALTSLCRARPNEKIWHTVVSTIVDFAERYGMAQYKEAVASLSGIVNMIGPEDFHDLWVPRTSVTVQTSQPDHRVKFGSV